MESVCVTLLNYSGEQLFQIPDMEAYLDETFFPKKIAVPPENRGTHDNLVENVPPEIATRERNEFAVTVHEFLRREQARLGGASHATAAFLVLLHTESGRELLPCKSLMGQLFKVALLDSDRHNILLTVVARPPPVLRLLHEHPLARWTLIHGTLGDYWSQDGPTYMVIVRFDEYDVAREISFVTWYDLFYSTFPLGEDKDSQDAVVATKDAVPDKLTEEENFDFSKVWLLKNWCFDDFEHTLREHFRRIGCDQAVEMREHNSVVHGLPGGNIIWDLMKCLDCCKTSTLVSRWRAEVQARSIRLFELLCDLGMLGPLMKSLEDNMKRSTRRPRRSEEYESGDWECRSGDWDRSIADDMGFPEVRDAIKKMLGSDK